MMKDERLLTLAGNENLSCVYISKPIIGLTLMARISCFRGLSDKLNQANSVSKFIPRPGQDIKY